MILKHTFFFRKRFNSSFRIFVDFLSFSEQSDETIDNKTEQLSLQYGKDESTGTVKVHADDNVVSRQMMRLRRKLKFYCWEPELQFCFFFSFWQFLSLWFLGCCVVRLKETPPCSSYQRLTCSWRDGQNFWNWQFIDLGPILKMRVLKAHYYPQTREKSKTFSKL